MHRSTLIHCLALLCLLLLCTPATAGQESEGPLPYQVRAELDEACQTGQAQACLDLGEALRQNRWLGGDQTAQPATAALERACELGSCTGCLMTGKDDRAVHVCVAPCEAGDRQACYGLMVIHRYAEAADSRPELAPRWAGRFMALAQTACDGGEAMACNQLGIALTIGYPDVPIDLDAGRVALTQAEVGLDEECRAGHMDACALLVAQHDYIHTMTRLHARQTGQEPGEPRPTVGLNNACRALRRDCAGGTRSSCRAFAGPLCEPRP